MEIIKYWVLCATDADAKYIKQNNEGCLAMFAEEDLGRKIEAITPDSKLHEVEYVKLSDYDKLVEALERIAKWDELDVNTRCGIGSNGVRDYYIGIAQEALKQAKAND